MCKQCTLGNHDECTGRVHSGENSPKCTCECERATEQRNHIPDNEMLLLLFSEWLDREGLIVDPSLNPLSEDPRTHHDLVTLFLEYSKVQGFTQYAVTAEPREDASGRS